MPSLLENHRLARKLNGPPRAVTAEDRLAVLEQAVAEQTGQTVEVLREQARQRANDRRQPSRQGP